MQPIFVIFIILSILWLVISIVHAKRIDALPPTLFVIMVALIGTIGILFIAFAEKGLFPFSFLLIGVFLLIVVGIIFVVMGLKKKSNIEEVLLKVNPARFNLDRMFFDKFGRRYFYFKSIFIGLIFIFMGFFVIFKHILR